MYGCTPRSRASSLDGVQKSKMIETFKTDLTAEISTSRSARICNNNFLSTSDPLNSCNGDRYIDVTTVTRAHEATGWRQQRHPAASTIALGPPQAPKFSAWKRCLHCSKALGRDMLLSAGLDRTAAATVACSTWRERRENRTTGGRVSTAGGSKGRAEQGAGGQQTRAADGKKYVDELGRG